MAEERLPPIPAKQQSEAQRDAAAQFFADRNHDVFGPFVPLIRSPQLMIHAARIGQYLRWGCSLPRDVSEFAILLQARRWSQPYEWFVHAADARQAGLDEAIIAAVAAGRRPENMSRPLQAAYDFSIELNETRGVSDATYARAVDAFGEQGMIDLVAVNGYYQFIAMVLNVARTPLPPGHEPFK